MLFPSLIFLKFLILTQTAISLVPSSPSQTVISYLHLRPQFLSFPHLHLHLRPRSLSELMHCSVPISELVHCSVSISELVLVALARSQLSISQVILARSQLSITTTLSHFYTYRSAGNVVCSWGRGEDGQLGHGDTDDRLLPTQLSALDGQDLVFVTCRGGHTIAYSESCLEVCSWGWGDFGRLGHRNSSDSFIPQLIRALQGLRIKQIAWGGAGVPSVSLF